MGGYSYRSVTWKKKLCLTLMISLLTGSMYFLQSQASSPEQEEGINSETENPAVATSERSVSEPNYKEIETFDEITYLQVPKKLEIVIDPWEIDEKEQIYSKPFTVKNTGDIPGILTLSFTCKVKEKEGVTIMETQEGLHDSKEKLIYIKAVFESGEEFVFTEEKTQCQTELLPGEEVSLWFEGEVNENAKEPWRSGDIEIEGMYSWEKSFSEQVLPDMEKKSTVSANRLKEE